MKSLLVCFKDKSYDYSVSGDILYNILVNSGNLTTGKYTESVLGGIINIQVNESLIEYIIPSTIILASSESENDRKSYYIIKMSDGSIFYSPDGKLNS